MLQRTPPQSSSGQLDELSPAKRDPADIGKDIVTDD